MDRAQRDRRHQANLDRINSIQLVVGRGDRARIDQVGTLVERARLLGEELRAHEATERGLAALDRLLRLAEERHPRRQDDILTFLDALWSKRALPLDTLRGDDETVTEDMLAVLDAFRHARMDFSGDVTGGPARVCRVLERRSPARA